jgi:hypothetical protein
MKSTIRLIALLAIVSLNNSCSKKGSSGNNNTVGGLATQPSAQAAYDSQSGGIYKGELTGSSGYFEINLQASTPFLAYQWTTPAGNPDTLYTTSLSSWASGQAIVKAVFTASDGSVFWFSVNADGSSPSIDSVNIPSHNGPVHASLSKELSTSLIRVYAGSATPENSDGGQCKDATLNMWTAGSAANGNFITSGTTNNVGGGIGTISGGQLTITMTPYGSSSGNDDMEGGTLTISSDFSTISGTVSNTTCTHTVSMTRIF